MAKSSRCPCTKAYHHCTAHDEADAIVEERDRLRWVVNQVAESVIVRVVSVGKMPHIETTKGCGICAGEWLGGSIPDGMGMYDHKDWCPRKQGV